jgi:hypothetical protein
MTQYLPYFIKILKSLNGSMNSEFEFSGVQDPFLQVTHCFLVLITRLKYLISLGLLEEEIPKSQKI